MKSGPGSTRNQVNMFTSARRTHIKMGSLLLNNFNKYVDKFVCIHVCMYVEEKRRNLRIGR